MSTYTANQKVQTVTFNLQKAYNLQKNNNNEKNNKFKAYNNTALLFTSFL